MISGNRLKLAGGMALAAFASCDTKPVQDPPSFIIFLTDDLGYGDLACYGNPINSTPNLDLFASQGVRLTDCHSAGTVCSPSRAGILTGRNPYRSGFHYIAGGKSFLRDQEVTIAELLKQKGYQTGFFGKWHLSNLSDSTQPDPGDQGFDYWMATSVNPFEGPENPVKFIRNGSWTGVISGWYCDIIVKESLEWLSRIDRTKPFLLVVCTHEPHTPIAPPDSLMRPYLDPELLPQIQGMPYGGVDREGKYIQQNAAKYYGTIKQLDNAFGRLINEVDNSGLKDNTLVFFTSDNGPEHPVNLEESLGEWSEDSRDNCYGTPGIYRGMKRYPFEGGHRVPGLVRWPKSIPAGIRSDELINGTDLLPIFCQLAEVEVPADRKIDGEPVFDALLGKETVRKEPCIWIFPTHEDTWRRMPHMALRSGDFVITGWFPVKGNDEKLLGWMKNSVPERFGLYNLKNDPGQSTDLTATEPQLSKELSEQLIRRWLDIRQDYTDLTN
jgi:arylsulfatase A